MQDSKDIILKQAFNDCPVKLSVFKIRCEKALDARAGDLKYHSICWHQYITARVPEFAPTGTSKDVEYMEPESSVNVETFNTSVCNKDSYSSNTTTSISKTSSVLIISELMEGIKDALAQGNVLTVKDSVDVYDSRVHEIGKTDERVYSSKSKWMKTCISDNITNIKFESTMGNNSSQRVISTDMNALILHIAEKYAKQDDEEEFAILKKAAQILSCRMAY